MTIARRRLGDALFVAVAVTHQLLGTGLIALGLLPAAALLATGGDGAALFGHLENLGRHYLAADPAARAVFERDAIGLVAGLWTLVALAGLPRFVARLRRGLSGSYRHG